MPVYKGRISFVTTVICYCICAVTRCAKLYEEIAKSKLALPFIISLADGIAGANNLIAYNHNIFSVICRQKLLLMIEVVFKLLF